MGVLYPEKKDFLLTYSMIAPVSLFLIRAKECEMFSKYSYERPILDIGCGEGVFAEQLFKERMDVGYDLSLRNVRSAGKSGAYQKVCCGKAENLSFASSSFKTVISNCVLEHVRDVDMVFREICRVLSPGGRAYLSVVTPLYSEAHSLNDILYNKLKVKARFGPRMIDKLFSHNFKLERSEWEDKIKKAGLRIEESHAYLSPEILHLMGLFLIFSIGSFLCKRTLNRWRLFPKLKRPAGFMNFMRKKYEAGSQQGGCLFFVVSKGV